MDQNLIKKLDSKDVYGSIRQLGSQISQAAADISQIDFPDSYKSAKSLAISGMGGSIYSYYVIKSLFPDLAIPLTMINDYILPKCVDKNTLFIGSSYSGTTEETIKTTTDALSQTTNLTAITSGGALSEIMKKSGLPFYQFDPKFNPSGQPRIGLGYMIFGLIFMLAKLDFLKIDMNSLALKLDKLKKMDDLIQAKALEIKELLKDQIIIFVSAQHLAGNVHIARNQLNETAKTYAEYHLIPELNHHLMEGLKYPLDKTLFFLFFDSPFFSPKNQVRVKVTAEVLTKQNLDFKMVNFQSDDILEEMLFFLQFGSYLSFFMAVSAGLDPSLIPYVDYFKQRLAK